MLGATNLKTCHFMMLNKIDKQELESHNEKELLRGPHKISQ